MKLNWNFLGGRGQGGAKQKKNLPREEYGYFLELHNCLCTFQTNNSQHELVTL